MTLNPLYELKRKLDDDSIPLPKRVCLAKNVIQTHYFPAAAKERIISEWLIEINKNDQISVKELKNILNWLHLVDDPTSQLKSGIIKILTRYVQKSHFNLSELSFILDFIENLKIKSQLDTHIGDFLTIIKTLLQYLNKPELIIHNGSAIKRLFTHIKNYYKDSRRKLEFINKFVSGDYIETVLSYLHTENIREYVLDVCRTILFPMSKKSFYASFLQSLIRKDNIDDLVAEKGDNIQSVLKIMNAFFTFPSGMMSDEIDFLSNFMEVFVSCYRSENQLIFMFYVMAVNALCMQQNYLNPAMIMPPILIGENSDRSKKYIFLNMINFLIDNEVEINMDLTETLGEKSSRVEVKKNFTSFLQNVMFGQIKLEGKLDKLTLKILKSALLLDPMLIEPKIDEIIPTIMCAKKNNQILELYSDMLEYLLEVLFKLNRGMLFINQMLPHVKIILEANNTEQFELKQKMEQFKQSGQSYEKIETKLITGEDLCPKKCVEKFGRLTSELMFRQNGELLLSLQSDFEEHCTLMLEEGFVSPSIIIMTDVMSAILSSMLDHSKMADHTVPEFVAQEFWKVFEGFEKEFLRKFGECVLKLNYNLQLTLAFLRLSLSVAQLKILNYKYANVKAGFFSNGNTESVLDLNLVLPCLNAEQWTNMADRAQESEAAVILNDLLLLKIIVLELLDNEKHDAEKNCDDQGAVREYLIKEFLKNNCLLDNDGYFSKTLLRNLNKTHVKQMAKGVCKMLLNDPMLPILKNEAIVNNKQLLLAFVMETLKHLLQVLEDPDAIGEFPFLSKTITKTNFLLKNFFKKINFEDYVKTLTNVKSCTDEELSLITNCLERLKELKIQNLNENCQLAVIFVLLSLKKACGHKKLKKSIDIILQMLFELSPKCPDFYVIYPVNFVFDFDNGFIKLLMLNNETNNTLIIRRLLETTVKKVKTDSEIVQKVVKTLVSRQKTKKESDIGCFGDSVFQISCMILPIISKEKKNATSSVFRSILANLQEKLHKSLLKSFKNNSSEVARNCEDFDIATLNAIEAFSLTLSKHCESADVESVKDLDCLWSGLDYFVRNAMLSIENADAKLYHVNVSIQLLNTILRYVKKLETHRLFEKRDETFSKIWHCLKKRLHIILSEQNVKYKYVNDHCLEEMGVTIKFLCELSSVDCFRLAFVEDLSSMMVLKKATSIEKEVDKSDTTLITHLAAKKLWRYCVKSNLTAPKCAAVSKQMYRICKNEVIWIRNNYDTDNISFKDNVNIDEDDKCTSKNENTIKIADVVCEIIKADVNSICEVILASKKVLLDYKFIDAVFELQHMLHFILGFSDHVECDISWESFFIIFEGSVSLLNALVLAREELLEDRWPCFLQNYRILVANLCKKSTSTIALDRVKEEKLAEISHTIEKLTHSLCKRKIQISRLAAYVVADVCCQIEKYIPSKSVRQHLENSVVLLIQAADSTHAMAFLRRALAGNTGQMTMTNLYTVYKRYHKYVGNA